MLVHAGVSVPIQRIITSSLGGALAVAAHAPPASRAALALQAWTAFVSGMDLALVIGAIVVGVAAVLAELLLPSQGRDAVDLSAL